MTHRRSFNIWYLPLQQEEPRRGGKESWVLVGTLPLTASMLFCRWLNLSLSSTRNHKNPYLLGWW